jgi:hypothetical protein
MDAPCVVLDGALIEARGQNNELTPLRPPCPCINMWLFVLHL